MDQRRVGVAGLVCSQESFCAYVLVWEGKALMIIDLWVLRAC